MPFLIPIALSAITTAAEAAASESAVMFVAGATSAHRIFHD
ncbi:hypothetical protein [uncultured Megasphaera sp.]|nr:hypothetical protein [uncultured Megasphaera sp.]